jgi:hypothetical protein
MKWLFLLLLSINIGVFAWGYQKEQEKKQPASEANADVGNMRLIGEMPDDAKQEVAEATDKLDADTALAAAEETKIAAPDATQEQAAVATATESVAAVAETPRQPEKPASTAKDPGAVRRCGTIGPINDRQIAKEIEDDLKKSNLKANLERNIEKEQIGYWVVIPPLADGSQAQAKIEELAQMGIKDIWHFRGGGMKNAISLGMFSKKENAENFSQEVLKKGFQTEMQPRYINRTRYLVKFRIELSKTAADIMWRTVERKYSKRPFSEQKCE